MPVTRSVGKGRAQSSATNPSSSEGTTATSGTSATETTVETSATEISAETSTTETTATTADTSAATGTSAATEKSGATTRRAESLTARDTATPSTAVPPKPASRIEPTKRGTKHKTRLDPCEERMPLPDPQRRSAAGSTRSRSKAQKIARAKEDLLRIQAQLAAATLARIEAMDTDDEEDDDASIFSKSEVNTRVDTWLNTQAQAMLAISNEPHQREPVPAPAIDSVAAIEEDHRIEGHSTPPNHIDEVLLQPAVPTPAGVNLEPIYSAPSKPIDKTLLQPAVPTPAGVTLEQTLSSLSAAITSAIKAGQKSKFVELPEFSGSHKEWLPFRAAYKETEDVYTKVENVNRLRKNLKGKAKEAVQSLLINNTHPTKIMETLETRFGRPESIAKLEMDTLRALPRLNDSPRETCVFSTHVTNAVSTLENLDCVHYLHNPELFTVLLEKLTPSMRLKFYDFADTQPKKDPALMKFEKFMKRQAEICAPYALPEDIAPKEKRPQKVNNVIDSQPNTKKCPSCEIAGHSIEDCDKFKKADVNNRWDIAKNRRLCFRCLRYRSQVHSCRQKTCGVNGCKYSHHKMLHADKVQKPADPNPIESINSAWTSNKQSYLKIVPVKASGPKGTIDTFALLDDGSTVTLIDESIANDIGAQGPVDPLHIEAIHAMKTAESESRRVNFTIEGPNRTEQKIQARTMKNLKVSPQRVSKDQVNKCRHLRDIGEVLCYENARPLILIGQDNWHLLISSKIRKGNAKQPVASLTPLGWVLHGTHTRTLGRNIDYVSHIAEVPAEENLEDLMRQYFAMDGLCLNPRRPKTDPDEQALRILEENTVHTEEGRYETALLWRNDDIVLPNNYESSLNRLFGIEKKLDRNAALKEKYNEQMEALIYKGYAEPAPIEKTPNRTWYLPHFAVINPMKPDKLRVVHDAAAKTKGVSLNHMLLKGPDLLQSLPGVVMRFRQHQIAVTADIKEMFMQVKLRVQDRDALRYLWRKDRRDDQPPEEYRMTSLIFGASSSPSTAIFVKNLNAKKHEKSQPEAAAAIIEKHYVDDYLDSFKNTEDAVRIATGVRDIHRQACYELKQWKSNSPQLLEAVGEENSDQDREIYKSEEQSERVLGLIWKPYTDELTFNLNLARLPPSLIEGKTPTKREALRIVMSLFDPLGFASPVTIRAKQILQEVWRRGTAWDEEIAEDLAEQWKNWMTHLRSLSNLAIPRRYLQYSDATTLQLHVFTDASESAYSAVLYWRATSPNNEVNVSLIMAKAKVAPLKLTSIPRLELQAAVMGTRLAEAVIEEHERKPDSKTFWTDSKTVLTWIKTGSRSYKPYVAHRLAAIEDVATVNEWRWVPTKTNVADDATRDVPIAFNKEHRWYKGPEFLHMTEESWPTETTASPTTIEPTGEERTHHIAVINQQKLSEALPDVTRFSNWERLRFTTARVLQFIQLCRTNKQRVNYKRTKKNTIADPDWRRVAKKAIPKQLSLQKVNREQKKALPIPAELLKKAERLLMRSAQEDSFQNEIENLKKEKPIHSESRLKQLSVEYIDRVLRLRSRIQATELVSEDFKSPMILDGGHPIVKLWIVAIHKQRHHAGVEATVNECRQQYWILRLRPTTRSLLRMCLHCRMKTRVPPYPRTGDLPPCRLAHHKRPFTYTGVDYFGPLTVTVGRNHQKRYVAIFTCLTTRAIHLEIAASLSTDSAIMALRRMIARRGRPAQIWSDNGTNLRGADKELRRAIDEATAEEAAKKTIAWRFIPPGAPFMGGAWERMVRSVKTALEATLHERYPTEEVLSTLLAEVEYTVNSRPLTHVSVSEEDPEALTPNHFLLGGPGQVPTPGEFNERDTITRTSWRAAQRLADVFWARWLREYLPELQKRREPHGKGPNVKVGDLVQLIDANLPRNVWIRGRVAAVYPGPDSVVRTVDVSTKGGVLRRPVRKLVILPIDDVALHRVAATRSHGGRNVQDDAWIDYTRSYNVANS